MRLTDREKNISKTILVEIARVQTERIHADIEPYSHREIIDALLDVVHQYVEWSSRK